MTDEIIRRGKLRNGVAWELVYSPGARWDEKRGWVDWSGDDSQTTPTTSAIAPRVRISYTGNTGALRELGCIDDKMWLTMQRSLTGAKRGHCGRDCHGQEWSRARRPSDDDPGRIVVRRRAKAPDSAWPFHLPAVTELSRMDVLREHRRKTAEKEESRKQFETILALTADETRELIYRLRAEGWGNGSEAAHRFLDALSRRAEGSTGI